MVAETIDLQRILNGLTFKESVEISEKKIEETDENILTELEKKRHGFRKLNIHRINRIKKTYIPSQEVCEQIMKITSPQIWMLITEDWCGDSAQNIPYIFKLAECNNNISLRLIPRDENPDIMDMYLTDGKSRSIPKLVAFDENGNELFQWGPRPEEAIKLVKDLKEQGFSKEEFEKKLHLWYAKNKGKNLEEEFIEILKAL